MQMFVASNNRVKQMYVLIGTPRLHHTRFIFNLR